MDTITFFNKDGVEKQFINYTSRLVVTSKVNDEGQLDTVVIGGVVKFGPRFSEESQKVLKAKWEAQRVRGIEIMAKLRGEKKLLTA